MNGGLVSVTRSVTSQCSSAICLKIKIRGKCKDTREVCMGHKCVPSKANI